MVALATGPLSLVQPLIVSELLFAVPVSTRLRGHRPAPRDWAGVITVVAGLAIGIVAADPKRGEPLQPFSVWGWALLAVAVLVVAAVVAAGLVRRQNSADWVPITTAPAARTSAAPGSRRAGRRTAEGRRAGGRRPLSVGMIR